MFRVRNNKCKIPQLKMMFMGKRRLNNLQLTLLVIAEVVPVQAIKKYGGMKV